MILIVVYIAKTLKSAKNTLDTRRDKKNEQHVKIQNRRIALVVVVDDFAFDQILWRFQTIYVYET